MNVKTFRMASVGVAIAFTAVFAIVVVPAVVNDRDIFAAFAAGFVNPYSSGYSSDVIFCWVALAIWVVHEASTYSVRYGWVCLVLGIIPGVAVGFPLYLVLRSRQLRQTRADD